MKKILPLFALGTVFSLFAFGDDWSGKLIDANCYTQQKKSAGCDASGTTKAFAIEVSGKVYSLDANGNTKAASAMGSRADRAADPSNPSKGVAAKVSGTLSGTTIAVDSIDVE
jgi:hypothetical protein